MPTHTNTADPEPVGVGTVLAEAVPKPNPNDASAEQEVARHKEEQALARMEDFVRKRRKGGLTKAYEDYLRTIPASDPSRQTALARLDELRFAPYRTKGTRAAMREFVIKYPDSAIAQALEQMLILDHDDAAHYAEAVAALEELQTAVGVGLTFAEYSRRVIDMNIKVNRAFNSVRALPKGAVLAVGNAMDWYKLALNAWNMKIQNAGLFKLRELQERSGPHDLILFGGRSAEEKDAEWERTFASDMQEAWQGANKSIANARKFLGN